MYNIEGGMWIRDRSHTVTGLSICEFGDQLIWEHAKSFLISNYDVARDWYLARGAKEYVSFDTNGQNGALAYDLTKSLPEEFHNRFDVVTNIGTTEHLGNGTLPASLLFYQQWQAFYSAVQICKIGGVVLHNLPPEKQWEGHSHIHYKDGLGSILAKHFGCELKVEQRLQLFRLNPAADYICIHLVKTENVLFDPNPPIAFNDRIAL